MGEDALQRVLRKLERGKQLEPEELKALKQVVNEVGWDPKFPIRDSKYFYFFMQKKLAGEPKLPGMHEEKHSLAFIELDRFKKVNERYGHAAGDTVLEEVSRLLSELALRHNGLAARHGGDEFVLYLPHSSERAKQVLQEIRKRVSAAATVRLRQHVGRKRVQRITFSAGLVGSDKLGKEHHNFPAMIDRADYAAKLAKIISRNRLVTWHPRLENKFLRFAARVFGSIR